MNSFQLFLSQVQSAPEPLKIRVLHVVFDILMVHDKDFLGPTSANVSLYTIMARQCLCSLGCLRASE